MGIEKNDLEIIEQALQAAIAAETDDRQLRSYRHVLMRLHAGETSGLIRRTSGTVSMQDGFRYDYDDAADLYEDPNIP